MLLRSAISFHPKLAAALDALFGLVLIWWVGSINTLWLFGVWWLFRAAWWFGLVQCMYYPLFLNRTRHWLSLVVFNLGGLVFLIFVDSTLGRILLKAILLAVPFVSFWLVPERAGGLSVLAKPERRWRFLSVVFALVGFWSGAFALVVFGVADTSILRLEVGLAAVLSTVAISLWWWREYGLPVGKNFWLSGIVLNLIVFEVAYCFTLWPLGYLVSGLLITWIWYVLWLLLRFALTVEGIIWRRQRFFLATNAVFFTLFLVFITRWK